MALPAGLIHNATSLTVDVTFHTSAGGVILGYQNAPLGNVPGNYVPALYVGTDGKLYGSIYSLGGLHSNTVVNDGASHYAVLTVTGNTLSLSLDGVSLGQTMGTLSPLDMTFNQLGTGYTVTYPAGITSGSDPFIGTLDKVVITTNGGSCRIGDLANFRRHSVDADPEHRRDRNSQPRDLRLPGGRGLDQRVGDGLLSRVDHRLAQREHHGRDAGDPQRLAREHSAGFSYLWQATDSQAISSTGSQALSFNGTNQFVDLGNPTDLNFSGQITLEAWIKPESTTGLQDIIAHGYQVSPNDAEDFLRINNGYYQVGSWNGNTAIAQAAIPAGDVGQWVYLAGVYNGTQWMLYRDGVPGRHVGPDHAGSPAGQLDRLGHRRRGRRHRAVLPGRDRRREHLERRPLGGLGPVRHVRGLDADRIRPGR